jgi:putative peptidoglycan lipid II flippase
MMPERTPTEPEPQTDAEGRPDLRAARVVAVGMTASKPTGYVRDALLAARFGTGRAMDAYTLASTTAFAAFDIIGTPLQRVLVPVLVAARQRRGRAGMEQTATAVLWTAVAASLVLGLILLFGAGPLAAVLAGHGALAPATAALLRWLALLPVLLSLSAVATAWLQAGEHFTLPSFTGLPLDMSIIAFVLFAGHHGVLAAAWGLVVGTSLQYLLQWPGLLYHGRRTAAPTRAVTRDPGLQATAGMVLPLLISVGAVQGGTLLEQGLAARLAVGTLAALGFARRVLDLPSAVFTLPVTTVSLPRLASLAGGTDAARAPRALGETAWVLASALVPCALLLALLRAPLAAALYEHGAFGTHSVSAMSLALLGLAPGVLTWGMQQLYRTYFYSRQDPLTPMRWDLVALAINAAVDLLTYRQLGQFGLGLGWSLAVGVAWWGMARQVRRESGRGELWPLRGIALGGVALLAGALAVRAVVPHLPLSPWENGAVVVAAAGLAGAVAYVCGVLLGGGARLLQGLAGSRRAWGARPGA